MNILDYLFLAVLFIFIIRGFARGLINEVFGIGSFLLSLFFAFCFYPQLGVKFAASMNALLANIVAFFAIFVAAFIFIKIIQMLIKTIFSGPILNSLDKTLGLILGFCEGVALVFLILFVLSRINGIFDTENLRSGSMVSNILKRFSA